MASWGRFFEMKIRGDFWRSGFQKDEWLKNAIEEAISQDVNRAKSGRKRMMVRISPLKLASARITEEKNNGDKTGGAGFDDGNHWVGKKM
ncbi:MAG TPA: hypothetical protein VH413_12675 [Verrucomicrobiae bacterium]|nr:hypothetical protein [Verrucomicrobiae bacterium]